MRNVRAILLRELAAYFFSPTAYVVLFCFILTQGITFYFYATLTRYDPRQIDRVIQLLFGFAPFWILFLLIPPILTMRLFAEERRSGSWEMLMTAPVTSVQVVIGKFLAAEIFFVLLWSTLLVLVAIFEVLGNPDWGPVVAFFIGVVGLGAFFNAVGVLASALTRNQLVAAILAVSVNLGLFFFGWGQDLFPDDREVQKFFDFISFRLHFVNDYSRGLVDLRYLALYGSFTGFLLYFAVAAVEGRRLR